MGTGLRIAFLAAPAGAAPAKSGKTLFENTYSQCHSLALLRSQQLSHATWQWGGSDRVEAFGLNGLNWSELNRIIGYLTQNQPLKPPLWSLVAVFRRIPVAWLERLYKNSAFVCQGSDER